MNALSHSQGISGSSFAIGFIFCLLDACRLLFTNFLRFDDLGAVDAARVSLSGGLHPVDPLHQRLRAAGVEDDQPSGPVLPGYGFYTG